MGSNISIDRYTLEISHVINPDYMYTCCLIENPHNIYTDSPGYYIFKEKNKDSPRWLLYQGVIKSLLFKTEQLFLNPHIEMDVDSLEEQSIWFENYYKLVQYVNNDISNDQLSQKVINYNKDSIIDTSYLTNVNE